MTAVDRLTPPLYAQRPKAFSKKPLSILSLPSAGTAGLQERHRLSSSAPRPRRRCRRRPQPGHCAIYGSDWVDFKPLSPLGYRGFSLQRLQRYLRLERWGVFPLVLCHLVTGHPN